MRLAGFTRCLVPAVIGLELDIMMTYVERGNNCESASKKFEIASNTVRKWYNRYKAEGNYLSKKVGGKKVRITCEQVADYVNSHPNFILSKMWENFGMTASGALYWLRKLGYSYKKPILMLRQERRNVNATKKS